MVSRIALLTFFERHLSHATATFCLFPGRLSSLSSFSISIDGAKAASSATIAMPDALAKEVGGRTVEVDPKGFGFCPPTDEAEKFGLGGTSGNCVAKAAGSDENFDNSRPFSTTVILLHT